MSPPALRFTADESEFALETWDATCGPHVLAAALALDLNQVQVLLSEYRGWMNPTMIAQALERAGCFYRLDRGLKTQDLCDGISRIQFEGSWMDAGVPPAAVYRHTHWVASFGDWVFCTAVNENISWVPARPWRLAMASLCEQSRYRGWHATHHYRLSPAWHSALSADGKR